MWSRCCACRLGRFISGDGANALNRFVHSDGIVPELPWELSQSALAMYSLAPCSGEERGYGFFKNLALGFRVRYLHGIPSMGVEQDLCAVRDERQQQHEDAVAECRHMAKKADRQVVAEAVAQYLHLNKQIPLQDALTICQNAPLAISKIFLKAKTAAHGHARVPKVDIKSVMDQYLQEPGVDEVQLFLASIGQDYRELKPSISKGLDGEEGLIACVKVLTELGIPRKSIWSLYKRETRLFASNPAYLAHCIHALQDCGVKKEDVPKLVQLCPALLGHSLDEVLQPLFKHIEELGLNKDPFVGRLLKYNPQRLISTADEKLQKLLDIFSRYLVPKAQLVKALQMCPRLVILVSDSNVESVLQFLKEMGLNDKGIGHLLGRYPQVLTCNTEKNLKPKIGVLEEIGIDKGRMCEILRKAPGFFRNSLEQSLKPKMSYLRSAGFGVVQLEKLITRRPTVLGRSVSGSLTEKVDFFLDLGFVMGSPQLARALSYTFSIKIPSLKARTKRLEECGFVKEEVFNMIKRNPSLLTISDALFQSKLEYLLNSMHFSMRELITYPVYFNLNLEQRIKARHRVLIWLKSQGLLKGPLSLYFITSMSDEKFEKKYVDRFPGTSVVYFSDRSA